MDWTILVIIRDFKNSPVFTDLQIQACKTFIALANGHNRRGQDPSWATQAYLLQIHFCDSVLWSNKAKLARFGNKGYFWRHNPYQWSFFPYCPSAIFLTSQNCQMAKMTPYVQILWEYCLFFIFFNLLRAPREQMKCNLLTSVLASSKISITNRGQCENNYNDWISNTLFGTYFRNFQELFD